MSDDEKVGYGHPPKKHQYRKGASGNPRGRPKGAKSLSTVIRKELTGKVRLLENGKPKKVSKMEALVKRLVKDALEGKPKALSEILKLAQTYLPEDPRTANDQTPVSAEDQALVDAFVKRMISKQDQGGGHDGT